MNKLTQDDVDAAADAIAAKGEVPTQEKVRAACGDRGSMSTINRCLASWRAKRAETQRLLEIELSPALQERALVWISWLKSEIREAYAKEHALRELEHERREAALRADLDAACVEADKLTEELAARQAAASMQAADLEALRTEVSALQQAKAELEAKAIVDATVIAELRAAIADIVRAKAETSETKVHPERQVPSPAAA